MRRDVRVVMENHMDEKTDNDMETGLVCCLKGSGVSINQVIRDSC